MLPSSFVKIMLEMHKAEDIILCIRNVSVRRCNFIESPSGFVFICAFVEQDALPRCVEGLKYMVLNQFVSLFPDKNDQNMIWCFNIHSG